MAMGSMNETMAEVECRHSLISCQIVRSGEAAEEIDSSTMTRLAASW